MFANTSATSHAISYIMLGRKNMFELLQLFITLYTKIPPALPPSVAWALPINIGGVRGK
jgi:hypothetical protein